MYRELSRGYDTSIRRRMDDDGERWSEREAQEGLPSTSNTDQQSNSYPVASPSQSLYSHYPVSQSLDAGYHHGFHLLVNQAGLYQPVRYDNISSSDGTQALPGDMHPSIGQGSYVAMVAPPTTAPAHHYNVMNVPPRTVAPADTHSHPFTLAPGDSSRSYALSQATTSGMSSSSVDNMNMYTTHNETGSSEAIPLVSHSSAPQEGAISSMGLPTMHHGLQHVHQEYSSNEPDTTQEEDMEQTLSSDPDVSLETSDSGVDSGPSSTVLVPEPMSAAANMASTSSHIPMASTSMNLANLPMASTSMDSANLPMASTSMDSANLPMASTSMDSANLPMASTNMNSNLPAMASTSGSSSNIRMASTSMMSSNMASTSMNPIEMVIEADAGISSSQGVVLESSNAELLVNISSGLPMVEPQEPSTSGTVDDGIENGFQEPKDDDSQPEFLVPVDLVDTSPSIARNRSKRKSTRMSSLTRDDIEVPSRPQYEPTLYDPTQIWCEPCQKVYPSHSECQLHPLTPISDKVVLSRAWSSLPAMLTVFRVTDGTDLGVFAKRPIAEQTQFGPFVADLVESKELLTKQDFILQVDREDGINFIEATDENACNWMMFVRPATEYAEQNMIAYQQGSDIFYVTTREIDAKQELKVWYSAHYAHHIGKHVYTVSEDAIASMIEQEAKWSCYECNKQFFTSAQLQAHLSVHDEPVAGPSKRAQESGVSEPEFEPEESERRLGRRKFARVGRPRGRAKNRGKEKAENFQSWKKKKTSLYLSRIKRYQNTGKQSYKSLYKKREPDTESGETGSEWMCVHCDLTFDNPNLLNLHTLTHAAEDVGLDSDEMNKLGQNFMNEETPEGSHEADASHIVSLQVQLECPVCAQKFPTKKDLIEHASEHARMRSTRGSQKPHKCTKCWKSFDLADRLQKHMLCHGTEESKPKQCTVCFKRFMNNSALSCHMKIHSESKYYQCLLCKEDFSQAYLLKKHVLTHEVNGQYSCTHCEKTFDDYLTTKKHVRAFHSEKKYPCPECDKIFPRPDKLKLHMLRHSNHREFMCETCGRQFKRKDKLKEHMGRMHTAERMAALANGPISTRQASSKKFVPKVSPMDFHRFIYKCHACMLGFKRRGMLVNHLAKRHPETKPDAVPELNLPILRTQKDYYCQYCEKVYKSSSKRKAHIIKNHPGAELPASARGKVEQELHHLPNPTFSQTVGSVTTVPHPCVYCHKQYASKAKLFQHQRKKHPDVAPPPQPRHPQERSPHPKMDLASIHLAHQQQQQQQQQQQVMAEQPQIQQITVHQVVPQENMPAADLLTQAMSELTQTLNVQDYRQVEYQGMRVINVAHPGQPAMLQQVVPGQQAHSTIELSHLGQGIVQAHYQPTQQQQQARESPTITQPMSPQQAIAVSSNHQQNPAVTMPTQSGITYMPARWTNYNTNYR